MRDLKLSTARNILIFMAQSADHITGLTGATLTITTSKAGAAFASITPTVTERTNGWYQLALTSGHVDTLGDLAFHITATGADPSDWLDQVVTNTLGDDPAGILEGSITRDAASRIQLSALGGKVSGAQTNTETFRDASDTKNRIVATVDSDGNRTAITLDGS